MFATPEQLKNMNGFCGLTSTSPAPNDFMRMILFSSQSWAMARLFGMNIGGIEVLDAVLDQLVDGGRGAGGRRLVVVEDDLDRVVSVADGDAAHLVEQVLGRLHRVVHGLERR